MKIRIYGYTPAEIRRMVLTIIVCFFFGIFLAFITEGLRETFSGLNERYRNSTVEFYP